MYSQKRNSLFLLAGALLYIAVAISFNLILEVGKLQHTLLMLWMLVATCALSTFALKGSLFLSRPIRISLHILLGIWATGAYVHIFAPSQLLSTILWLHTPLACVIVLLLVPHHIFFQQNNTNSRSKRRKIFITLLSIICILFVALCVRTVRLGNLGYSTDEGSTALYAWSINNTGTPCNNAICYLRGLPYLYTVASVTNIFGLTEFWVRFPGVVIELLGICASLLCIQHFWKNWRLTFCSSLLFTIADWQVMLGRYARMYGTMLFFMLIALYAYSKTFIEKKYRFLPLLCICTLLAMLTHQFGMLLIFFVIAPLLTNNLKLYRQPLFLGFALFMIIATYYTLTKLPGIIYLDDAYQSLYELHPEFIAKDKYWYLNNLQLPNLIYIKNIFLYYPISMLLCVFGIGYLLKEKSPRRWIALFVCWILFITTIYRIDYALKYLWWILAIIHIMSVFGFLLYWKTYRYIWSIILGILLCTQLVYGDYVIFSRHYGKDTTTLPILMPTHVEEYYPDDKTPVDYVIKHASPEDIIITDYWMQDVYLQTRGHRMSDARILRWDYKKFIKKFPYYSLYHDDATWRLEKDGPIILSNIKSVITFFEEHEKNTIWYISSVDFEKKEYLYISKPEINNFIKTNFTENIVYRGKDNHTLVYKISF